MIEVDPDYQALVDAVNCNDFHAMNQIIAKRRVTALASARGDDWTELVELIRQDLPLNEAEREFIATTLEGLGRSNPGRPRKRELTKKIGRAEFWLVEVDQLPKEAAVARLQELFSLSRSMIYEHLSAAKECEETQASNRRLPINGENHFKENC